jgi:hypothetical protein
MGLMLGGAVAALATAAWADGPAASVKVTDPTFRTGASMFAYTEYELSGEPLAESLGLNLDVLDPDQANQPDPFDFTAGIETYEFSEEAMYAVNYQSRLGPHLANGPVNAAAGGTMESLGKRFIHLAKSVGMDPGELPLNLYPITFPLASGNPQFGQAVDASPIATESLDITRQDGTTATIKAVTPAFFRDYGTLAWAKPTGDLAFTPVAVGGELLKDVMWAQDFLGGMHDVKTDEEVGDIPSPQFDSDGKHALGKAAADGINGVILTQITWDKLLMLRDRFLYDGKELGAKVGPDYDAAQPVWFPDSVAITLTQKNGVNALGEARVTDAGSSLRASWMMLWPLAELYGYSDQRSANGNKNNAFLAVFDGDPFPAAPKANLGTDPAKYVAASDPFSVTQVLSNMEFQNLLKLHFDKDAGTLVDSWKDGRQGAHVTTFDAAYAITALDIYQRALDALPVGYASAASGKPLDTAAGKEARALLKAQADFIVSKLIGPNGLVADGYTIGTGADASQSLGTQFATIRALSAAFAATGDEGYRTAARKIYDAVADKMTEQDTGLYNPNPGKPFTVTPWTQGAVMGALHELLGALANREGEDDPALTRAALTQAYTVWFKTVGHGMQLGEWVGDTGEHVVAGDTSGDVNGNGVKIVTAAGGGHGTAAVMAGEVEVTPAR